MSGVGGGEVVQMESVSSGGIPGRFTWRGRKHTVRAVASVRSGGSGPARRRWIELRTDSGMRCLVSVDGRDGMWRMERVLPARGG